MTPVRVGAVGYLNARPLVHGLDRQPGRFTVRFDVPSRCATLLHEGAIDVGLIPSIEYLARRDYAIVPGVAVASMGPVASVALFATRPLADVRSIALDSSSRTSAMLVRVLCARAFGIRPGFETMDPDLDAMLRRADAALLIGDVALYANHEAAGLTKIDLGAAWTALTSLPFVWAFWVGRHGALGSEHVAGLQAARDAGEAARDEIAREYFRDQPEKIDRAVAYLRGNIACRMDEPQHEGLRRFYEYAAELGLVPGGARLRFFDELGVGV